MSSHLHVRTVVSPNINYRVLTFSIMLGPLYWFQVFKLISDSIMSNKRTAFEVYIHIVQKQWKKSKTFSPPNRHAVLSANEVPGDNVFTKPVNSEAIEYEQKPQDIYPGISTQAPNITNFSLFQNKKLSSLKGNKRFFFKSIPLFLIVHLNGREN